MPQPQDSPNSKPDICQERDNDFEYQMVRRVFDEQRRLLGYLVIDSILKGRSCGGIRMRKDVSVSEVSDLARTMTRKFGFAGVPNGGAKAGIIGDPDMPLNEKRNLLVAFAESLKQLLESGTYLPAADMGTTSEDIRFMLKSVGLRAPESRPNRHGGFYTSMSVLTAAERAARHLGLELRKARVAIEGFGEVGSAVAEAFSKRGARIVAVSTDRGAIHNEKGLRLEELTRLYCEKGSSLVEVYRDAEKIDRHLLPELEVDVFSPCAGPYSIHAGNADRIGARIISPGANTPETPEAGNLLFQKGVLSLPDFVANCGGILAYLVDRKSEEGVRRFLDRRIGEQITDLLEEAETKGIPVGTVAEKRAEQRFQNMKRKSEEERSGVLRTTARKLLRRYQAMGLPELPVRFLYAWNAKRRDD